MPEPPGTGPQDGAVLPGEGSSGEGSSGALLTNKFAKKKTNITRVGKS